eukprot:jgi/Hompol1/1095/HPOL_005534-RA
MRLATDGHNLSQSQTQNRSDAVNRTGERGLSELETSGNTNNNINDNNNNPDSSSISNQDSVDQALTPVMPAKTVEHIWFKSKVVSRTHAEIWLKDGQLYLKDIGSSSGTFLNKLRLSPAGKVSRPYPVREGDVIQLGVDYQGRAEDIYKAVEMKVSVQVPAASTINKRHNVALRFRHALRALLTATNPYSTSHTDSKSQSTAAGTKQQGAGSVDCCICLSSIGPFQALFIAPCSHCFHYKCIRHVLAVI